jgi:hypothetical protein
MRKILCILCVLIFLGACASVGKLDKSVALNVGSESIFVIGVAPENYIISIFPGTVKNGEFNQNVTRSPSFLGHPDGKYIVAKASAGEILALTRFAVAKDKDSNVGPRIRFCEGMETMSFEVPAGKVIYLGDINFEESGDRIKMNYTSDIASAKQYVDREFPNLKNRLESWKYQMMPVNANCVRTIYIKY